MALQVGRDHLVTCAQGRQERAEHRAGAEPAVEQNHRLAAAVGRVVHVEPVDIGVGAGALRLGRPVGHGVYSSRVLWCVTIPDVATRPNSSGRVGQPVPSQPSGSSIPRPRHRCAIARRSRSRSAAGVRLACRSVGKTCRSQLTPASVKASSSRAV